jgi:hypothetical protein
MRRNNYIQPRGNHFYYIEVWDRSLLRDSVISDILGEDSLKPFYVNGSQRQLNRVNKIQCALFWKTQGSAEYRIETLKRNRPNDDCKYLVKELNREEFIDIIPDDFKGNKFENTCWLTNVELKKREINYQKKIEHAERFPKV